MTLKLKILCALSALSFLASTACLSAYAAEMIDRPSGEDEIPTVSYDDTPAVDPMPDPDPTPNPAVPDPGESYVSDAPVDPGYDSSAAEPDYGDSGVTSGDDTTVSSVTPSDLIDDSNYPQEDTTASTSSDYNDYNQYNNAYVDPYNVSTIYDDNYVYVPSYTEPEESLIDNSSKQINTDELTADDWKKIMLDLEDGNISNDGTKTFNFIKNSEESGDTSIGWMLYLGIALILMSIFLIIFVIISSSKAARTSAAA